MANEQRHLFDGFLRHRICRVCGRRLHLDKRARYRTREAGLCYSCIEDFERSPSWDYDTFVADSLKANAAAVTAFQKAADDFEAGLYD